MDFVRLNSQTRIRTITLPVFKGSSLARGVRQSSGFLDHEEKILGKDEDSILLKIVQYFKNAVRVDRITIELPTQPSAQSIL